MVKAKFPSLVRHFGSTFVYILAFGKGMKWINAEFLKQSS